MRDDDTNTECSEDKENTKTPVHGLEGALDVDARTLCFSGDHGYILWTDDAERARPERSEEALKSSKIPGRNILSKGTRVFPVAEAVCVVLGISSDHGDEGKGE